MSRGLQPGLPYLAIFRRQPVAVLLQTLQLPADQFALSTDGGKTWTPQGSLSRPPGSSTAISFVSARVGFIALQTSEQGAEDTDRVRIERTGDGGRTWTTVKSLGTHISVVAMSFSDLAHGHLLVTQNPLSRHGRLALMTTSDGGNNWSTRPLNGPDTDVEAIDRLDPNAIRMAFADPLDGWIISDTGVLLRTTDGGATWTRP